MRTQRDYSVWKCKDGRVTPIKEMDTMHVVNALRMLRRNGFHSCDEALKFILNPPKETMTYEDWEIEMMTMKISRFVKIFEDELIRRGVDYNGRRSERTQNAA